MIHSNNQNALIPKLVSIEIKKLQNILFSQIIPKQWAEIVRTMNKLKC